MKAIYNRYSVRFFFLIVLLFYLCCENHVILAFLHRLPPTIKPFTLIVSKNKKTAYYSCCTTSEKLTSKESSSLGCVVRGTINFSDKAKAHLQYLKNDSPLNIRMAVKKGGCSGMSYVMEVIESADIRSDDYVEEIQDDIKCIIDPKSLLFLHGLQLDYSDALIGGGFKFTNPNAHKSCGCGKSFGV